METHEPGKRGARARAASTCSRCRTSGGWWRGELQTNVTMDAEDMLLREFLGIRQTGRDRALGGLDPLPAARRRHLGELPRRPRRAVDHDRGLLGAAPGGRRARGASTCGPRRLIRAEGGLERARVFTHLWLALFGLWSWERVPALPAGGHPAALVGAAERLRLRLLGAPDDRRPVARQSPPAGALAAVRPGRARRRQTRATRWRPRTTLPAPAARVPGRGAC